MCAANSWSVSGSNGGISASSSSASAAAKKHHCRGLNGRPRLLRLAANAVYPTTSAAMGRS